MTLSDLGPAERHRRIAGTFTDRVRAAGRWDAPAPVAGWTARDVVRHLQGAYAVGERRACQATGFHRSSQRYRSRRDPQTELRVRLRDLAASRAGTATGGCTCCCGGRAGP